VREDGFPAALAAVQRRDGHTHDYTAGVADLKTKARVPVDGQVRIGSNTKTFTAVTLLQLVGEGKIDLDRPVETYLPKLIRGDGIDGRHITGRRLPADHGPTFFGATGHAAGRRRAERSLCGMTRSDTSARHRAGVITAAVSAARLSLGAVLAVLGGLALGCATNVLQGLVPDVLQAFSNSGSVGAAGPAALGAVFGMDALHYLTVLHYYSDAMIYAVIGALIPLPLGRSNRDRLIGLGCAVGLAFLGLGIIHILTSLMGRFA
jgi:hypothetical protein